MAFPTASYFNTTYFSVTDTNLLNIFVSAIQEYLETVGLSFSYSTQTKNISSDLAQSAWIIPYCQSITSIKIKSYATAGYSQTLVENDDYMVFRHVKSPNPIYRVEMNSYRYYNYRIARPYYLEIVGSFGFSTSLPATLEFAIANVGKRFFSLATGGYQSISQSKVGDTSVTIDSQPSEQAIIDMDFANIPSLQKALEPYILW